jgi:hypothetical protein
MKSSFVISSANKTSLRIKHFTKQSDNILFQYPQKTVCSDTANCILQKILDRRIKDE